MSYEENRPSDVVGEWLPVVEVGNEHQGTYYVLVSHKQLDYLVGSLMQMCELTGDVEQRQALKNEIKQRSRGWLNSLYEDSGYESLKGFKVGYAPRKLK